MANYKAEVTLNEKDSLQDMLNLEKAMVKPIIYNREFKPLKDLTPDAYRIFPYEGKDNKTKISIKKIKTDYPLAYKYLSKNKRSSQYRYCNQN